MTGQDLFGAGVRLVGLVIALYGIYTMLWGLLLAYWPQQLKDEAGKIIENSGGQFFFSGAVELFIGIMLIAEASQITAWAY